MKFMKYVECFSCSGRSLAESVEINEIIDWPFKKVMLITTTTNNNDNNNNDNNNNDNNNI